MKNKKGVSGVITAVIMIALVIVSVAIVWGVVNKMIEDETGSSSCMNLFEKITINGEYTCYNSSSNELRVAINVANVEIDELLLSISDVEGSKSFTIPTTDSNLREYSGEYGNLIKLPKKNAGLTYFVRNVKNSTSIKIAPIINEKQCEIVDSLKKIDDCKFLIH
jgi:flagellin-like protein